MLFLLQPKEEIVDFKKHKSNKTSWLPPLLSCYETLPDVSGSRDKMSHSSLQHIVRLAITFPGSRASWYLLNPYRPPYLLCARCACCKRLCVSSCEEWAGSSEGTPRWECIRPEQERWKTENWSSFPSNVSRELLTTTRIKENLCW